MTIITPPPFGWLPPTPEKQAQSRLYSLSTLGYKVPESVEVKISYPDWVPRFYNQGNVGACVGLSCSVQMTLYNQPSRYDGFWLYRQAKIIDNDPNTDPDEDTGAYLWAGEEVLRKKGHRRVVDGVTQPVSLAEGLESYYFCYTADDIRTAYALMRPVVLGIPWYEFPITKHNGEYWIGRESFGQYLGGHAISSFWCSDLRDALCLRNTWGESYPPVWISYDNVVKLLSRNGEGCVGIDRKQISTSPSASPSRSISRSPSASRSPSSSRSRSRSASSSASPSPSEEPDSVRVTLEVGWEKYGPKDAYEQ